jgi:4-carboxymuconolactone decarboxylase
MDEGDRYKEGERTRRAVLGDAHVDRSLQRRSPFHADFQDFLTRYAWGEVWTRPGLSRHTRSLVTVAMLVALNRQDELRMHLRAAFTNGVSEEELKELLLHSALYCGLPAANAAMHLAEVVVEEVRAGR